MQLGIYFTIIYSLAHTWCVAKPSSSNDSLMDNLDYACDLVHHEECTQLKNPSCPCSNPNTIIHCASFAMNAYYQEEGSHQWNFEFKENGVAKPMTSDDMIQANINFACNYVDCSLIRHGGGCYHPDTLINHASVIMNLYYQAFGRENSSCDFKNTGCIVMKDPSYGNFKYKYQ
ncbi:glucan endo-1 [Quercus suber]|uniref:Glucan endo-1 n=1 Tax=Quercus suber TaxID=58331 RepID=A0AAW0LVU0_QUESU